MVILQYNAVHHHRLINMLFVLAMIVEKCLVNMLFVLAMIVEKFARLVPNNNLHSSD
jgi:hypothetical protein